MARRARRGAVKRLGIVIATGPSAGDLAHVRGLARAARARGIDVRIFAMHEGVEALAAGGAVLAELADGGCELVGCATSADRIALRLDGLGVVAGSQDDHAALVHWADRVVAFT